MELETKVLSRELQRVLYDTHKTVGTAESCTGGSVAQAIIATPGSSDYFKGGIIAYSNEIKETLLAVKSDVLEKETAVCEEVAKQMVEGALHTLNVDYAVATTGIAGPGGGSATIPAGTIWLAVGNKDKVETFKLSENFGRDINLAIATNKAMSLLLTFVKEQHEDKE